MSGTQDHVHSSSDSHGEEDHTGPIKTPKQLAWAVFFAFIVPIVVIIMLASYVTSDPKPAAGSDVPFPDDVLIDNAYGAADPLPTKAEPAVGTKRARDFDVPDDNEEAYCAPRGRAWRWGVARFA